MAAERLERNHNFVEQQPSLMNDRSARGKEASKPDDIYERDARLLRGKAMVEALDF